jgi:electron transfer flavoprotein alpha subunit
MMATLTRSQRPWFMTIEQGVFEAWPGDGGPVTIKEVTVDPPDGGWRTEVVGQETPSGEANTIRPDAEVLLVAGAGWTKKQSDGNTHVREAEDLIRNFLEVSRASLGSSKSLVDQSTEGEDVISFMTHLNQVGQTGATPRHRKGLSTCCHGEEPHVVGWRFIKERRAVNLDPNCGWAQGKADVVYVADAFEVMTKVNELLA